LSHYSYLCVQKMPRVC